MENSLGMYLFTCKLLYSLMLIFGRVLEHKTPILFPFSCHKKFLQYHHTDHNHARDGHTNHDQISNDKDREKQEVELLVR